MLPDWVSLQVTPWLAGSLATVAVNCRAVETFNEALVGEMVTDTGDVDVTVIVALADLVLFETEVAVSVTVGLAGTVPGAV